jgi:ABC-type transport system involved in multi-copper enzyme maturation permease subunit
MLGPIFHLEMLLGGRRGRQYWVRWFIGGMLLLQLSGFYISYYSNIEQGRQETGRIPPNAASLFGTEFTSWLLMQQFFIILLATPVVTAGAITDEKMRGTLLYLFAADLNSWEILVGKLLGRAYEIALLLLVTLPFLCFIGVWGGVTLPALAAVALSLLGPMFAVGSMSLLMSVWCRQTRDAVVGLYAIGGLMYACWLALTEVGGVGGPGSWLAAVKRLATYFDPYYVAQPAVSAASPKVIFAHLIGSWVAWGILGGICFGLALWRLRPAYMRQLEHSGKETIAGRLIPKRARVSDEPLLWKERHVDGIAPLAVLKLAPRWFALPAIVALTILLVAALLAWNSAVPFGDVLIAIVTFNLPMLQSLRGAGSAFLGLGVVVLILGSLIVGIRCSGAICGERERQSWEALLLTPLETKSLIRNKLWGILGAAVPYVLAYTIPALILATMVGPEQGWLLIGGFALIAMLLIAAFRKRLDSIASFWVALIASVAAMALSIPLGGGILFITLLCLVVTALAMFYMGAAGVWCSVRCSTSWRSLLATMGLGYVGGLVLWLVTVPITLIVALFVYLMLEALGAADNLLGTSVAGTFAAATRNRALIGFIASCVVLAGAFLLVPWYLIRNAEYRVGFLERIRIWRDEFEPRSRNRRLRRVRRVKEKA